MVDLAKKAQHYGFKEPSDLIKAYKNYRNCIKKNDHLSDQSK